MQQDIFANSIRSEIVDLGDNAWLDIFPQWIATAQARVLFNLLLQECEWEQPAIRIAGRDLPIPRLQCWYGDKGAVLRYSGKSFPPHPWLKPLAELNMQLATVCKRRFNSVLVNCYRDGSDSVGWHADDEPELGEKPLIASISLGATRRFSLKHKFDQQQKTSRHIQLRDGDLVIMRGNTQANWVHAIQKTTSSVGPRINLTFRNIRC
ncbi:alpha-ketoglutarate-dependent dioxygenase AlkB family protein [Teredinibacter turnerae]|uniref:alpha-ketoglutarate-dependent dioxygenase AlkB family protein n=1 Tax=Teredinibacter turnerae TaxID=2426 RepID=UPI00041044BC|nr:alpha-ketoglutarate-dependent dioxygenase AlkB [Teredinibacter turnerae]